MIRREPHSLHYIQLCNYLDPGIVPIKAQPSSSWWLLASHKPMARWLVIFTLLCRCGALDLPDVSDNTGAEPSRTKPGGLLRGVQNVLYPPIKLFREVCTRTGQRSTSRVVSLLVGTRNCQ